MMTISIILLLVHGDWHPMLAGGRRHGAL